MSVITEPVKVDRLILVYAADSGALPAIKDSVKKLFRLRSCALCLITHGMIGEKDEWKDYTAEIGVPVDYYHRDDMPEELKRAAGGELPAIFAQVGGGTVLLLSREVLEGCSGNVSELRRALRQHAIDQNLEIRGIV